ncbi:MULTISPECIES: TIGR02281 family clan AA aspartic protease [Rhodomicrobium]|uniref:retropepsin-like aspartic protease family protein n=1 Tax=Rhodomicrobium TaxID=1068 RepID=UPI000B4A9272|nr:MULTISPECIES: TIGR02281 family clan AA aspartic protease [Rhodomicrobium]
MAAWLAIFALIVAAIALVVSNDVGSIAGIPNESFAQLVAAVAILIFLGGAVASSYRGRTLQAVKHLASWAAMLFFLVGVYAYRGELALVADRVMGELAPHGSQINVTGSTGAAHAVRIKRGWSGHFVATAEIKEKRIEMIVDTGASTVVLRHEDAKRLGIDTKKLRYTVPVQTANGSSYAARVELDTIMIGNVGIKRVEALIAKPGSLHQSLLGMTFLSRLRSYEFAGDYLELRG